MRGINILKDLYNNDGKLTSFKVDMKQKFLFSDMIVQAELERRLLTVS